MLTDTHLFFATVWCPICAVKLRFCLRFLSDIILVDTSKVWNQTKRLLLPFPASSKHSSLHFRREQFWAPGSGPVVLSDSLVPQRPDYQIFSSLWQQIPPPGCATALWLQVTERKLPWFVRPLWVCQCPAGRWNMGVGLRCLSSCRRRRRREPSPKNNGSLNDSGTDRAQQIKIEPSPGSAMAQINWSWSPGRSGHPSCWSAMTHGRKRGGGSPQTLIWAHVLTLIFSP